MTDEKHDKGLFRSFVSGVVSIFSPKSKQKWAEIAKALWPKFEIVADPSVRSDARGHWKSVWTRISVNDEEGWKMLGEMIASVMVIEKKKVRANDRLLDVKRALEEKMKNISLLNEVVSLESEYRSLRTSEFFPLPYFLDSLVADLDSLERRKFDFLVKEERSKLDMQVQEQKQKMTNEENLLASALQNFKSPKIAVWIRGDEQICQCFAAKFLNDRTCYEVKHWPSTEVIFDFNAPTVLLNLHIVQSNVKEIIEADPDYVKTYELFENCLLIRLHKYEDFGYSNEFHNDIDDGYVPSTIRGLHSVLKLQYLIGDDGVRLYDSANQFARFQKYSHPTAEEKMTNFYFLLDGLVRSSKERLSLLQGLRDSIEH